MVRSGDADVALRAHPHVVGEPEHPRRHVYDHWSVLEVEHGHAVDGLRVTGEKQSVGVEVEHRQLVGGDAEVAFEGSMEAPHRGAHHVPQEHLPTALEVELVVQPLDGRLSRVPLNSRRPTNLVSSDAGGDSGAVTRWMSVGPVGSKVISHLGDGEGLNTRRCTQPGHRSA